MATKIELKRPVCLQGKEFKKGVHDVDDETLGHWMIQDMIADGDALVIADPPAAAPAPDAKAAEGGKGGQEGQPDRDALMARAKELELKPHPNTGIQKLQDMIAEAEAKKAEADAKSAEGGKE